MLQVTQNSCHYKHFNYLQPYFHWYTYTDNYSSTHSSTVFSIYTLTDTTDFYSTHSSTACLLTYQRDYHSTVIAYINNTLTVYSAQLSAISRTSPLTDSSIALTVFPPNNIILCLSSINRQNMTLSTIHERGVTFFITDMMFGLLSPRLQWTMSPCLCSVKYIISYIPDFSVSAAQITNEIGRVLRPQRPWPCSEYKPLANGGRPRWPTAIRLPLWWQASQSSTRDQTPKAANKAITQHLVAFLPTSLSEQFAGRRRR